MTLQNITLTQKSGPVNINKNIPIILIPAPVSLSFTLSYDRQTGTAWCVLLRFLNSSVCVCWDKLLLI